MAVKVEIKVETAATSHLYIIGSTKNLGAWNINNALLMEKDNNGLFTITKMLEPGEIVEFKVLSEKSWDNVEKGVYGEEISNHIISPHKGLVVNLQVARFAK